MTKACLTVNKIGNVDLVLNPVITDTPLTSEDIYGLISDSPYQNLYINKANINNAIEELNIALTVISRGEVGKEIKFQILEKRNAKISIAISPDNMSAFAEITTALGGNNLNAKTIIETAQAVGIKKGFIKENLVLLTNKSITEAPGTVIKYQIAQGEAAINGQNAKIQPLVASAQERILQPQHLNDGTDRVDMRNLGDIICVDANQAVAKKIELTLGEAGFTVTGEILKPKAGKDIEIKIGEGTTLSPENNNILISTQFGLPRVIENGMAVDNVYQVKNVNVASGHVKFKGSVIIEGDVCDSMEVTATGDITIGGVVESAKLDAGGDITIKGGIIGKKHEIDDQHYDHNQLSASISAKGKVFAKYSQYAYIQCSSLTIENQMMHCVADIENNLWLGSQLSANGKLIAGCINIGYEVKAGMIGAASGVKTTIIFDKIINQFKERKENIENAIEEAQEKTPTIEKAIAELKALPKEKENIEKLNKLLSLYKEHINKLNHYNQQIEGINIMTEDYLSNITIEAKNKLFNGVNIYIDNHHQEIKRDHISSRIYYKEHKIQIESI